MSSSAGSFHSIPSKQAEDQPQPWQPPSPSQQSTISNLEDVSAWLSHPDNVAMLQSLAGKANGNKTASTQQDNGAIQGVADPAATITTFNLACQQKGVSHKFELQEASPQRFIGTLHVGNESVSLDVGLRSKKDAKAWLAREGLPLLANIEDGRQSQASASASVSGSSKDVAEANWVGKLVEYTQTLPFPPTLKWEFESPVNQSFIATLTVDPSPISVSGTDWILQSSHALSSKKAAKSAVAEQAVKALIDTGRLAPDGSVLKAIKPNNNVANNASGEDSPSSETYATRVAAMYQTLGLPPPVYRLAPIDPIYAPSLISGAAYFPGHPIKIGDVLTTDGGPIGKVSGVHGKKAAKEECARQVLLYLEALKTERMNGMGAGGS